MSVLLNKLKERHKEFILVSETLELMSQANENCPLEHVKTYLLSYYIHHHTPVFYLDDYFRLAIDPSEETIRNFDGFDSTLHELTNDKVSDNAYFPIKSLNDFEPIQEFDIFAYKRGYHYIANHSVGKFITGEKVIGLTEDRAIELLKNGAIKKLQINNKNIARQSNAPPPPNHINIAPTSQKIIDKVIEAEKPKEATFPNKWQHMTMLYDYFTPHQACCFIAGLHPNFNGCDDGLEMAECIIEGGFKSGKLIVDSEHQIKSASLKSFLYSKNWIMKGFNDNLTDDTHSPNKENSAYQKRIAELEQQLAEKEANASFMMGTPTVEQGEPRDSEQIISDFRDQITQLTAENNNLNSRLSTARNTYKQHRNEIKALTEKNEQVENEKAELIEQMNNQAGLPADDVQLNGIAKYNADKAYIISTSQALAKYIWGMDTKKAIRTGDMVQQIRHVMHNVAPNLLPDDKAIREWLSGIAPDYAKKGGKTPKDAPSEISLIMKK
ncbi:hypothetical protein AAJP47_12465 [Psychrobacter sp. B38]|uniref:hypothetical protein n=1 Tax=Psychrobacter sp. B38 TaxID=3143538 RepID=UPI00320DEE0F